MGYRNMVTAVLDDSGEDIGHGSKAISGGTFKYD
jgi:hypothetical protein